MIRSIRMPLFVALGAALVVGACGPAAPGEPTPGPATIPPATATAAATAGPSTGPAVTPGAISPATLEAAPEVQAGAEFDVTWTGPNGSGDFVTIVKPDAAQGAYLSYFDTTVGSPGSITAPLEPGAYEVRYVLGEDDSVLARRPITVIASVVTLDAPDEVARGAAFQVTWTGPDGNGDYVTVVAAGAAPARTPPTSTRPPAAPAS